MLTICIRQNVRSWKYLKFNKRLFIFIFIIVYHEKNDHVIRYLVLFLCSVTAARDRFREVSISLSVLGRSLPIVVRSVELGSSRPRTTSITKTH